MSETKRSGMNADQRESVKNQIAKAYEANLNTWAYYLELCLRVNELPVERY